MQNQGEISYENKKGNVFLTLALAGFLCVRQSFSVCKCSLEDYAQRKDLYPDESTRVSDRHEKNRIQLVLF